MIISGLFGLPVSACAATGVAVTGGGVCSMRRSSSALSGFADSVAGSEAAFSACFGACSVTRGGEAGSGAGAGAVPAASALMNALASDFFLNRFVFR